MQEAIVVRGARENNLRGVSLVLPHGRLIVFTGVSGSGKSSLAFETLYAEGQRRYIASLSNYARQFLDQLPRPDVDAVLGIPPALSIDQKSVGRNPRSTVGTITEIHDFLRVIWARIGEMHCPLCDEPVGAQGREAIVRRAVAMLRAGPVTFLSPLVRDQRGSHREVLADLRKRGYLRARVDGAIERTDQRRELDPRRRHQIDAVVDRLAGGSEPESRVWEAVEGALALGRGRLVLLPADGPEVPCSTEYACPRCGASCEEPTPAALSFNTPQGWCPECRGLGRRMEIMLDRLVPDASLSIAEGALTVGGDPASKHWAPIYRGVAERLGFTLETPWRDLTKAQRDGFLYGLEEPVPVQVGRHRVRVRFEGIVPHLLGTGSPEEGGEPGPGHEARRVGREVPCTACGGTKLRPESLAIRLGGKHIASACTLTIAELRGFLAGLRLDGTAAAIAGEALLEAGERLRFLGDVGVDYLTVDRPAPSLSGGEAQRIRLAAQLGRGLAGVLYVLDEPSIGLHQRDNRQLIETLRRLRDRGSTVIVVEHDEETIRCADHIVDFGPGAGLAGGHVVAQGGVADLEAAPESVTGAYLRGAATIPVPARRRSGSGALRVVGARHHNLRDVTVEIPAAALTVVTGVSGSGKSTLVTDVLLANMERQLDNPWAGGGADEEGAPAGGADGARGARRRRTGRGATIAAVRPPEWTGCDRIEGWELFDKVIAIDQSPIGRIPRSNPATYTKVWDHVRALYAQLPEARVRGYAPGRFSFNVEGGRCPACEGNGALRIDMDFLADVWVRCEACGGSRFLDETLQVRFRGRSIAELLEMSVAEALAHFREVPQVARQLQTLVDVGLGYIRLGQPSPTVSGGEAQRIKLSRELGRRATGRTLYVLDEPTTGLHFRDVSMLLDVLQRLIESGNTIVVVEHNLDVVKVADHVIDLGPEGGAAGGRLLAAGTPEEVARSKRSATGTYLREVLEGGHVRGAPRPPAGTGERRAATQVAAGAEQGNGWGDGGAEAGGTPGGAARGAAVEGGAAAGGGAAAAGPVAEGAAGGTESGGQAGARGAAATLADGTSGAHVAAVAGGATAAADGATAAAGGATAAAGGATAAAGGATAAAGGATAAAGGATAAAGGAAAAAGGAAAAAGGAAAAAGGATAAAGGAAAAAGGATAAAGGAAAAAGGATANGGAAAGGHGVAGVGGGSGTAGGGEGTAGGWAAEAGRDAAGDGSGALGGAAAAAAPDELVVVGARQNNLRDLTVRLPKERLIAFAGPSGAGKTSLALDTIYAEGQRRYVESLSAYARQFLGRAPRPAVGRIDGLCPAIAVDQRAIPPNSRSTVGTLTETYDYVRLLFARAGDPRCPTCGGPVRQLSADRIAALAAAGRPGVILRVLAPVNVPREDFGAWAAAEQRAGYARFWAAGTLHALGEAGGVAAEQGALWAAAPWGQAAGVGEPGGDARGAPALALVVDRVPSGDAGRLAEAAEAVAARGDRVGVQADADGAPARWWSLGLACEDCGAPQPAVSAHTFAFNDPRGWCAACEGTGTQRRGEWDTLVPLQRLSIAAGGVGVWGPLRAGPGAALVAALGARHGFSLELPLRRFSPAQRQVLLRGDPTPLEVAIDGVPVQAVYAGLAAGLEFARSQTHWGQVSAAIGTLLTDTDCPDCGGSRIGAQARAVRLSGRTLPEVLGLPLDAARDFFDALRLPADEAAACGELLREVRGRLRFLCEVGLGYLTLGRSSAALSGGEGQRMRLASQLGSGLTGVLYVLDEPTVGLHPRDTDRLLGSVAGLRALGNTVLAVDHDERLLAAADHLVEFGPGSGVHGGLIVAQGPPAAVAAGDTGVARRLRGQADPAPRPRRGQTDWLVVRAARLHNLQAVDGAFPLGNLVAVTGVSGSGKTSLVIETLYHDLARRLHRAQAAPGPHDGIEGAALVDKVIRVDQEPIGDSPRSNPATYTGIFDTLRSLYARVPEARARGYDSNCFSYNHPQGRCDRCEGHGHRRIAMHFLPDVWVLCDACAGRRYRTPVLQVLYRGLSIADCLQLTVDQALERFAPLKSVRPALEVLAAVGLGYLRLGQPAPTLSAGEAQRLKLARELARPQTGRTLYVLDEPTTGLSSGEVTRLLTLLHGLVDRGNTVICIEHNLDVVCSADWVVDMGPEGGAGGGRIVAAGPPEAVAVEVESVTAPFLREALASAGAGAGRGQRLDGEAVLTAIGGARALAGQQAAPAGATAAGGPHETAAVGGVRGTVPRGAGGAER